MKFRATSMHYLMTRPRNKFEVLSETAKTHLLDLYISKELGRREDIKSKFLEKGNEREEDAITMLSLLTGKFYKKNSERLENDFFSGEPDIYEGADIRLATHTLDTKCSWNVRTFYQSMFSKLDDAYYYQGQVYMDLTGADTHTVCFCLTNTTDKILMDERRKLSWQLGIMPGSEDDSPEYIDKAIQIEKNLIYNMQEFLDEYPYMHIYCKDWNYDLSLEERLYMVKIDRDDEIIAKMKVQCEYANEYLIDIKSKIEANKNLNLKLKSL